MQVDYLIVGQGICGTLLSWFLHKEGKTFVVVDDNDPKASTKIAAGIINPVTGRRYAYSWMIEEVMPFAWLTYKDIGKYLNKDLIAARNIIDFFPSPQMRNAFVERITENDTYLHSYPDQNHFNPFFQYDFGCGEICPAYLVNLNELLFLWREKLSAMNALLGQRFDTGELKISDDSVSYGPVQAGKIIFCDGISGVTNQWFQMLPYAPNKGEALLIECEGLENDHIYKKGLLLAPTAAENIFWTGSNYQWEFADDQPSTQFLEHATSVLKGWLKTPFKVIQHMAAIRPATIERRPFVGFHPLYPNIGILNGMGTKGSSLAPFFASQLAQNLVHQLPINPEANVSRFSRILSKAG